MTTTLADPRLTLWRQRKVTLVKLAELRMWRGALCGCQRCNDSDRIEELDSLIAQAVEWIGACNDRICDAAQVELSTARPPDASTSNGL